MALTREQIESVCRTIATGKSDVEKLDVSGLDMTNVERKWLVEAVSMVEAVHMVTTKLHTEQWEAVFLALCGRVNLKSLDVSGIDLSEVDPAVLASSLSGIEELAIRRAVLTHAQTEARRLDVSLSLLCIFVICKLHNCYTVEANSASYFSLFLLFCYCLPGPANLPSSC